MVKEWVLKLIGNQLKTKLAKAFNLAPWVGAAAVALFDPALYQAMSNAAQGAPWAAAMLLAVGAGCTFIANRILHQAEPKKKA